MINKRCTSHIQPSLVGFDIVKMNPFNHLISREKGFASLFSKETTKGEASFENNHGMLTLQNI